MSPPAQTLLAINGSPSPGSRTRAVADLAVELAGAGRVVNLSELDADGLLARRPDRDVETLLGELQAAGRVLPATPVYRATYSGLLKVLLDQLPLDGLRGVACVLAATAAGPAHELCLDHGLRPVVASAGGWTVPTAVYAVTTDFDSAGRPGGRVAGQLTQALYEAALVLDRMDGLRPE